MERKCRYEPLSAQPLVLVLCQVRFSPVRVIEKYVAAIQDEFRREGFPIERAAKVQQVTLDTKGAVPVQVDEQQRWEYRNTDETWSILVMQDSVILQTTAYTRFEDFAQKLQLAVSTVLAKTEHDSLGLVHRVGLRYIDVIRPRRGADFRFYVRPGFHGVADDVFQDKTHRLHVESRGHTSVGEGGYAGTFVVRVVQNDQGLLLPPDLVGAAPQLSLPTQAGEVVTLIDMDHWVEGNFQPSVKWVVETAYGLHDHLVETFHDHVVTGDAIAEWK